MAHPDVPAEQAHVDHAYARLRQMRERAEAMLRDAFGEQARNLQAVTERDIRVRSSLGRIDQLELGAEALVFGRIDRREPDGTGPTEVFHIGRLGISDVDQEPLVVDWRAPVAEPFYRATGAHPMALRRRRHFLTAGARILDLEDETFGADGEEAGSDLGLSGQTVLLSTLARSRTGRMRDIVATVQREQDEIVRGPLSGVLVVQGGPGTGKTAVALHRAAYLLYTHRFPLERQGVLVVGPSRTFLRYIEHVLPSLGESGVEMSTVAGLYGRVNPTGEEDETVVRLKGDPRMARFLARAVRDRERPLRRRVLIPYGRAFLRLDPATSERIVTAVQRRPGHHNARRRTVETLLWRHLVGELARRVPEIGDDPADRRVEITGDDGSTEIVELPSARSETIDPGDLGRALRRVPEVADALDRMWPVLTPEAFLHDLFGARPLLDLAGRGILSEEEQASLFRPRSPGPDMVAWTSADIALLDEAREVLGSARRRSAASGSVPGPGLGSSGGLPPLGGAGSSGQPGSVGAGGLQVGPEEVRAYGHIVVDEAQDLSPMELRMIARRTLSGSMTVLGDIAQATGAWAPSSWARVVEHLPTRRGWRQVDLTVNYRTPAEIMVVADRILRDAAPGMRAPEPVRTAHEEPEVVTVEADGPFLTSALPAAVSELVAAEVRALALPAAGVVTGDDAGRGTVGVICPHSLIRAVRARLAADGVPVGDADDGALDRTVSLLGVADAKGLEFDSVVVVEPRRLVDESPQGLRALYVAVTRATRRLAIVHAESLPGSLEATA